MSADRAVRRSETCECVRCGHHATFDVDHPQRGDMAVCSYHARQMRDAFDSVEVSL